MEIFIGILLIFILSFLWALFSLKKHLRKQKYKEEADSKKENHKDLSHGEEVVLFERKN